MMLYWCNAAWEQNAIRIEYRRFCISILAHSCAVVLLRRRQCPCTDSIKVFINQSWFSTTNRVKFTDSTERRQSEITNRLVISWSSKDPLDTDFNLSLAFCSLCSRFFRLLLRFSIRLKTQKNSVIDLKTHNSRWQPPNPRGGYRFFGETVFLPFLAQFLPLAYVFIVLLHLQLNTGIDFMFPFSFPPV